MSEPGFELTFPDEREAEFIPYAIGMSGGKDLQIIDQITKMPLDEFEQALEDPVQQRRGVILLAMIGLSIRAKHPDWTVERVVRTVLEIDLPKMTFFTGEKEEESNGATPLTQEPKPASDDATSGSPSDESESSATPKDTSAPEPTLTTSVPSSEIPA